MFIKVAGLQVYSYQEFLGVIFKNFANILSKFLTTGRVNHLSEGPILIPQQCLHQRNIPIIFQNQ